VGTHAPSEAVAKSTSRPIRVRDHLSGRQRRLGELAYRNPLPDEASHQLS